MTGSRRLRFADAMSIFARSTRSPFLNSPARIRANSSAFSSNIVDGLVVHVYLANVDEMAGPGVELLEVFGGKAQVLCPVESEPLHVTLDRIDVLHPLLCWVRVIKAQVAAAAEFLRELIIRHDRLRLPQVEVAVRLGWKARNCDTRAAGLDVRRYDAEDEIAGARSRFSRAVPLRHLPPQAWSSSGGCTPKPCILSDHCSATTAPLTGCRRDIEAKAEFGR